MPRTKPDLPPLPPPTTKRPPTKTPPAHTPLPPVHRKSPLPPPAPAPTRPRRDGPDEIEQAVLYEELLDLAAKLEAIESEALGLWEPLPVQDAFHKSKCRVRLIRGGNRGGKTLTAAIEVARAVTNSDPHGKYPKEGDVIVVGRDLKHLGTTILPKLLKSEKDTPFWTIQDKATGKVRAYHPWSPEDRARKQERRVAPPLIPDRLYGPRDLTWHSKGNEEPERLKLSTGWTLWFFSGKAPPPKGMVGDIVWLDEEIEHRDWFPEMNFRIIDRSGCIIWTFTPQAGTEQAFNLSQQAQDEELKPAGERNVEEFFVALETNPHIGTEEKKAAEAVCVSEEDYLVRIKGQFAMAGQIVWPEYSPANNGIVLEGGVPENWTRYAVIDPGYQICAVLFAAVPDPNDVKPTDWDLLLYDELYIPACSAETLARKFYDKVKGHRFEAFVIDDHGSRVSEAGSGRTVREQYEEAFRAIGIRSERSGHGFWKGSDDVQGGLSAVRSKLRPNPDTGRPSLRVLCRYDERGLMVPLLPNWDHEIRRFRYKRDPSTKLVTDEPETRGRVHLMADTRYLVLSNPKFAKPKAAGSDDPILRAFLERQAQLKKARRQSLPGHVTYFGPAGRPA